MVVEAVKISKVKGHATEDMVNQGKVKREHKEGNDAADEAADIGVDQHGNDFLETSTFFAAKQKEYGVFIKQIHTLILAIMKEVSAIQNPLKPWRNNEVYKKVCKGLSTEHFQPAKTLGYSERPESFDLDMKNFPLKRIAANSSSTKACLRNSNMKDMFPLNKDYQQNTRNEEKYEVTFATKGSLQNSAIPYMQRLLNANQ